MALGGGISLPTITQRIAVDDSQIARVRSSFGKVGAALGTAVKVGAAGAAAGIGAFVSKGVSGARDVQTGVREVVTLFGETGQAAEDLADELGAGVAGLSDELGIAQDAITAGLYDAISAGVPKDNVFEFMEVAAKASVAGVTDIGTAVDGLTTTVNAFGLDADEAGAVADSMFAAVQGGKTTFEELSAALFNVAPAAAGLKIPFSDVNAALATLTASGTPTSVATTQMRAALAELGKEGSVAGDSFKEIAGQTFPEFIDQGGTLQEALAMMGDAAGGNATALQNMFGSVEAGAAAAQLGVTNSQKFVDELERQEGAAGAAGTAFETMEQTTDRAMARLKTDVQNAAMSVGSELLPVLADGATWLSDRLPAAMAAARRGFSTLVEVVGTAVELFRRFKTPIMVVAGVLLASYIPALVAAATATVVQTGRKIAAWVAMRVAGLQSIASVVAGFATMVARGAAAAAAMVAQVARQVAAWVVLGAQSLAQAARVAAAWLIAMGPIALVIAAVVGIVALIVKNWDTIVAATKRAWEWVSDKVSSAWQWVQDKTRQAVAAVVDFVRSLKDRAMSFVRSLWDFIVRYHPLAIMLRMVREVVPKIVAGVSGLKDRVLAFFGELRAGAADRVGALIDFVKGIPARILRGLGRIGNMLKDAGRQIIQGLIDGITSKIGAIGDTMSNVASTVRDFLPFSPAKEGPLSGKGAPDRAGSTIGSMLADGLLGARGDVASAAGAVAGMVRAGLPTDAPIGVAAQGATSGQGGPFTGRGDTNVTVTAYDPMSAADAFSRELAWQSMGGF